MRIIINSLEHAKQAVNNSLCFLVRNFPCYCVNPLVNDIPICEGSSTFLSLHHATLECIIKDEVPTWYIRDGQWYVRDGIKGWYLSTNGIKVNDNKIDEFGIELKANDIIKIGKIMVSLISE